MLVRKKMSVRKLAVYVFIIFLMMAGAVFMLYQNKKLTVGPSATANPPIVFNNSTPAAAEPSQVSGVNNNQGGVFNLNIFSSDKFKNLRVNAFIIKEPPAVGKRNPFKPN